MKLGILFLWMLACLGNTYCMTLLEEDANKFAVQKLRLAEVPQPLINLFEKSSGTREERLQIITLNVFGFMEKADYSGHESSWTQSKCTQFINNHKKILVSIESEFAVAKEVVVALLWVESKLGQKKWVGNFPVMQVYMSLLQADYPPIIEEVIKKFELKYPNASIQQRHKLVDRCTNKAKWALEESLAIKQMFRTTAINFLKLRGSYSGAFGISQFIPSSYVKWAQPQTEKKNSNLFSMPDALKSVAYYLKKNGWKKGDLKAQHDAIFHYNASEAYVQMVLKIAEGLTKVSK